MSSCCGPKSGADAKCGDKRGRDGSDVAGGAGGEGAGCCGNGASAACAPAPAPAKARRTGTDAGETLESVAEYYGKVLASTKDLKTSACTAAGRPCPEILDIMKKIPDEVMSKFYGCGTPIPLGINGLRVLDLGSGSGRDCFIASALVGPTGSVVGVDMTDEQLEVANRNIKPFSDAIGMETPNVSFVKGTIEFLSEAGIAPNSIDLAISNCVINLSPDKPRVIRGMYDVLREGGEVYFSDVYSSRRLPKHVQEHEVLWGECISGALYIGDFKRICRDVGFTDPRVLSMAPIAVTDPELQKVVGEAKFFSITYRLFKLKSLETECEDYGQVAVYNGTIPGHPHSYALDDHHVFETNKPMLVCGNTASMVSETWLKPYFSVTGDRSVHYGLFDCGAPSGGLPAAPACGSDAPAAGGCC